MAAIRMRLRADFRTRWRAWVAVAFLIGLTGGVVLTTAAGARRTGSAYARFLRASHSSDMVVSPTGTGFPDYYRTLARQTGSAVTPIVGYGVAPVATPTQGLLIEASPDARWRTSVERPKITAGRLFRPDNPGEVVANSTAAHSLHLHPGSTVRLLVAKTNERQPNPRDETITVQVVGLGVTRDGVVSDNALASAPRLFAGSALAHRFGPDYYAFDGANIELAPGRSKAAFTATAQSLARRFPQTGTILVADGAEQAAKVEHAIRPQAVALGLFAALTALTALFLLGQVLARQLFLASTDNYVLRELGMSRRQLFAVGITEIGAISAVGAFIATAIAVVASPTMPIGPARLAEPHPGVSFDGLVLGGGFVVMIVLLVASAVWPAWRVAQAGDAHRANETIGQPGSRVARWASSMGAPPSMEIGVGYAIDPGRGRTRVSDRSAIAVTALAMTALAASMTFGANLSRLVDTPRLYGQSWDLTMDAQFAPLPRTQIVTLLRREPGVTAWTFGVHNDVTIDGHEVPTIGLTQGISSLLAPTIIDGRAAVGPREIMLGTKTLNQLHRRVGQTITATFQAPCCANPGRQAPSNVSVRIVGRGVFPFFGEGGFTPTGLGVGAQVASRANTGSNTNQPINFVLVSVAPGPDHHTRVTRLVRELAHPPLCASQCSVSTATRPTDILNYTRVQSTPLALAAVLAILAFGVVTSLLVSSIRRRRRDIAILKTLGFARRQVSAAVAWQATTLVALALAIGLPIGAALGRSVWVSFATNLGVAGNPQIPLRALIITIPVALTIGNLIAAIPGIFASRLPPANVLRTL